MQLADFGSLIVYEDNDFFVLNKPAGIATLDDRNEQINMLAAAKKYASDAQACHRIDKDTSGVLVFAKNQEAYRQLSLQFQNREVNKIYHAVVYGSTNYSNYLVDVPLLVKNQGIVKWDTRSGKESETILNTIQNFNVYSLIECQPITGRRHQIRVHLKYLDHPIVGDLQYGGQKIFLSQVKRRYKQKGSTEKSIIDRMALHAHSIRFSGSRGHTIFVEAGYPKDFSILIKQLHKYGVN